MFSSVYSACKLCSCRRVSRYLGVGNVDHTTLIQTLFSIHYFTRYFRSRNLQPYSLMPIDTLLHFSLPQIQAQRAPPARTDARRRTFLAYFRLNRSTAYADAAIVSDRVVWSLEVCHSSELCKTVEPIENRDAVWDLH